MNNLTVKERHQALIDDKKLEVFNNNAFVPFKVGNSDHLHRFFNEYIKFRIKPKPVKVFGIEVEGIAELDRKLLQYQDDYFGGAE